MTVRDIIYQFHVASWMSPCKPWSHSDRTPRQSIAGLLIACSSVTGRQESRDLTRSNSSRVSSAHWPLVCCGKGHWTFLISLLGIATPFLQEGCDIWVWVVLCSVFIVKTIMYWTQYITLSNGSVSLGVWEDGDIGGVLASSGVDSKRCADTREEKSKSWISGSSPPWLLGSYYSCMT